MSENEDLHQFPLQGVSASRRETKSKPTINLLSWGVLWPKRRWKDHSHLYRQTLSQTFLSPICSPKRTHLFFLRKLIWSSHRSLSYEVEYRSPKYNHFFELIIHVYTDWMCTPNFSPVSLFFSVSLNCKSQALYLRG